MSDLRKAAQELIATSESCDIDRGTGSWAPDDAWSALVDALEDALAQPEPFNPDWDRVKALEESLREHMAEIHRLKALAQPEQLVVGGDDLPTLTKWTPMAEYAAKSAAVPGRAEALKQAGYTRRPRQLPGEDEQEPVAWRYDEATYRPDDLRGRQWHFNLFSTHKPYAEHMVQNVTPLYTHPPQRKPMTDAELERMYTDYAKHQEYGAWVSGWFEFARAIEKAHGIE
jgi:hypothetical protein